MPIKIPDDLPAVQTLLSENIFVMTEKRAITQDIRPLKLLLLNLMPLKIDTETQFARLLGNTPTYGEGPPQQKKQPDDRFLLLLLLLMLSQNGGNQPLLTLLAYLLI